MHAIDPVGRLACRLRAYASSPISLVSLSCSGAITAASSRTVGSGAGTSLAQVREATARVALDRPHRHAHDGGGLGLAHVAVETQDDGCALLAGQREQGTAKVLGVLVAGQGVRRGLLRQPVGHHFAAAGAPPRGGPRVHQDPTHVRVRLLVRPDAGPARERLRVRALQEVLGGVQVAGDQERQALEPGAAGHHVRVELLVAHVCSAVRGSSARLPTRRWCRGRPAAARTAPAARTCSEAPGVGRGLHDRRRRQIVGYRGRATETACAPCSPVPTVSTSVRRQ